MDVLVGMETITQKKKKEAEEERMREAQVAMDAEVSLEDFLGISGRKATGLTKPPGMKVSASTKMRKSPSLSILTKKIDLDTEISDVKFKFKADAVLGMKDTFYICDRAKSGLITTV